MSRNPQLKPQEKQDEPDADPQLETQQDENVKVIPTEVYIFNTLQYQIKLLENINNGISLIISCLKQAGFKVE